MNKILRVLIRIPFKEVFIFSFGFFFALSWVSFFQNNILAEAYSGVGAISSLVMAIMNSHKSHEEKEMIKQLKNARKMEK